MATKTRKAKEVVKAEPSMVEAAREIMARPPMSDADRIAESRKCLNEPLGPSQQVFEAPDGTCKIGEKDQGQLWVQELNNGKGLWINPRRQ